MNCQPFAEALSSAAQTAADNDGLTAALPRRVLFCEMLYLTGFEEWSCTQSSVPAMGFNGIAAAFLGGLSPIGTIFASFFIQHITNGGAYVDKTMYCSQISDFISSVIIYLCGFVLFIRRFMNSRIAKANEKRAALEKGGDKQ